MLDFLNLDTCCLSINHGYNTTLVKWKTNSFPQENHHPKPSGSSKASARPANASVDALQRPPEKLGE